MIVPLEKSTPLRSAFSRLAPKRFVPLKTAESIPGIGSICPCSLPPHDTISPVFSRAELCAVPAVIDFTSSKPSGIFVWP